MGQQIRAADCTNCNQGRGAECRCGEAVIDITTRLEPLMHPWTWRDAARAAAAVMFLATAAFLGCADAHADDGLTIGIESATTTRGAAGAYLRSADGWTAGVTRHAGECSSSTSTPAAGQAAGSKKIAGRDDVMYPSSKQIPRVIGDAPASSSTTTTCSAATWSADLGRTLSSPTAAGITAELMLGATVTSRRAHGMAVPGLRIDLGDGAALRITAHLPRLTAEPRTQVRAAVEMRF